MNKKILKILKNKWFFRFLVTTPVYYLIYSTLTKTSANPLETILLYLGNTAAILLLITLWISPLELLLPKKIPIRVFNIHKRILGVSTFFYASFHFITYYIDLGSFATFVDNFKKPYIIIGLSAFIILLILASTSFDWVIKKMKKKNWKNLHKLVYLVLILLFFHIYAKKGNYEKAILLIFPIVLAELIRFIIFLKKRKRLANN